MIHPSRTNIKHEKQKTLNLNRKTYVCFVKQCLLDLNLDDYI